MRNELLNQYSIEIGGGLGDLAGKVWRVGLMGTACNKRNVLAFLGALYSILKASGANVKPDFLDKLAD